MSSSRNNNLYPDCISNLKVWRGRLCWTGGKGNGEGEGERICMHLTFSHWLNYLVSNSHLEFRRVPTETVIIQQTAAGKQRSGGIFHGERWLTAIHGLLTSSWMLAYAISFGGLLGLHSHMKCAIHTFIMLLYYKLQSIKRVAVNFRATGMCCWLY